MEYFPKYEIFILELLLIIFTWFTENHGGHHVKHHSKRGGKWGGKYGEYKGSNLTFNTIIFFINYTFLIVWKMIRDKFLLVMISGR